MKKRAIILFGSTLVKRHGHWQTAGFERNVPKTAIGGKLRILAAYFLYKKGSVPIIILGGKRREKRFVNTPVIAGITKNELIKLGVPQKDIIVENKSSNTYENLINLIKILEKQKFGQIVIVSNKYHLPRIKTLIKYASGLIKLPHLVKISYRPAESVLTKESPRLWRMAVQKAYTSTKIKKLESSEKEGIKEIKNGSYNYTQ